MMNRTSLLLICLLVAVSLGACKNKKKSVKFGDEPIRAQSSEAQRQFDAGVELLEQEKWAEARDRFRLVQSQFPNDPIAILAELYAARSGVRELGVLEPRPAADVDGGALTALVQLSDSREDDRVRYAALLYYAAGLATMGQHSDALFALADYPGGQASPVVLASDRRAAQALIGEALLRAARFGDALAAFGELWRLAEESEGIRAYATSRAFEAASELPEEELVEWASSDTEFTRGVSGWTLLDRRASVASDSEIEALQALLRRIAGDLATIGEASRAESVSRVLAARGPAQRLAIGLVLPLSGANEQAGRRALDGALVAADAYGEQRATTTVVIVDSEASSPTEAMARLRNAGVAAIVGPLDNERAEAWSAEANRAEIPLFALTTRRLGTAAGDWAFRWFVDAESEARAVAEVAVNEQGDRTVAILRPNIGYGRRSAAWFTEAFEGAGGTVVLDEEYDRTATDYGRLAAKVARLRPDAIYIPDTAAKVGELSAFLAQVNVWGIDGSRSPEPDAKRRHVHYLGTSLWANETLLRQARSYVAGALIPAWSSRAYEHDAGREFHATYLRATGRAADDLAAFAADAVLFVRERFATGATDALSVRDAARSPTAFRGLTGPTRFGPDGEPVRLLRFITVADREFVATDRKITVGLADES